jgi:hypothetical protein
MNYYICDSLYNLVKLYYFPSYFIYEKVVTIDNAKIATSALFGFYRSLHKRQLKDKSN